MYYLNFMMVKIHLRRVTSDFYVQDIKKSSSVIVLSQHIHERNVHECKLLLQ